MTRRGLRRIDIDECLRLLGTVPLGRIAFSLESKLELLPVNFLLHEGTIIFRTTYGPMLDALSEGRHVVFEVDDFDAARGTGWSVVVHGRAEEIWMPAELDAVRQLPVYPWAPGDRAHYVRIAPVQMTGRRIVEEAST